MKVAQVLFMSSWMIAGVEVARLVSKRSPEDVRKGETSPPAVKLPMGFVEDGKALDEYNRTVTGDGMIADSDTVTGSEVDGINATDATDDGASRTAELATGGPQVDGTTASPEGSTTDESIQDATKDITNETVVESTDPKTDAAGDGATESATGTAATSHESSTELEPKDAIGVIATTDGDLTDPTADVPNETATNKDLMTAPPPTDGVVIIPIEITNSSYYHPWLASVWSQLMSMGLFSG